MDKRVLVGTSVGLAALATPARAAEVSGQAGAAVESLPDLYGSSYGRARLDLEVRAALDGGWNVVGMGNLHQAPVWGEDGGAPVRPDEADLQRLSVGWRGGDGLRVRAGRFVDVTSGGLARIDGLSVHTGRKLPVDVALWGGRMGHVEPTEPAGAWAGGVDLVRDLGAADVSVGGTLVQDDSVRDLRVASRGTWVGSRRSRVMVSAEYGQRSASPDTAGAETDISPADSGLRATLDFRAPVSSRLSLDGGAHWYGLAPIWVPPSALEAVETLVPGDYATGDLGATARLDAVALRVKVGPTWFADAEEPGEAWGLLARASAEARAVTGHPGVFVATSAVGDSWYAGGGLVASEEAGDFRFDVDAGLYRFRPLDGLEAWVGEGRLNCGYAINPDDARTRLRLDVEAAAGADRILAPWARAGVALRGAFGKEAS